MSFDDVAGGHQNKVDFAQRVDVLYEPELSETSSSSFPPRKDRIAVGERVHVLYSREGTVASLYGGTHTQNGHAKPISKDYFQFEYKDRDPKGYEKTIKHFYCLVHLMTACGLLLILFVILVPICTIVLSAILGFQALQVPGYLSLFIFIGIIVCVFLARSSLKKINRYVLFIAMAVLSAVSILITFGLFVVGIIGLNNDSPAPYGNGSGTHVQLIEILAMECVIVSSGVITFIVSCILLGISIYFSRGVHDYYVIPGHDTPNSERTMTPEPQSLAIIPARKVSTLPDNDVISAQRAQTVPRTSNGTRIKPATPIPRTPSELSVTQVDIEDPEDVVELDDLPPSSAMQSTRRWGKTKNVLKAIMDIKQ